MGQSNRFIMRLCVAAICCCLANALFSQEGAYDLVYTAESCTLPEAVGFTGAYRHDDYLARGFCGLAISPENQMVLHFNHRDDANLEYASYSMTCPVELKRLTIDITLRIDDDPIPDKSQFLLSAVLPDGTRPANRLFCCFFDAGKIWIIGQQPILTDCQSAFRRLRFLLDADANSAAIIDLDTGEQMGSGSMASADPKSKPGTISFGDGSSTIRGYAELKELKIAYNR